MAQVKNKKFALKARLSSNLKKTKQKHLAPNFVSDEKRKNDDIPRPKKKKEENQKTKLGIAQQ